MRLSIITINFNNKQGLVRTIESVFGQISQDFEYILIDGGSTDGGLEVIKKYASKIDYWVSEPDNGVYNAMNKGIEAAHGDYCIFMNSGDIFYNSEVVEKSLPFMDGNVDVIYGNTQFSNGEIRHSLPKITFKNLYAGSLSHQSTYIKTELLKKYKYDENLKIVSDWKFFLQTLIFDNAIYKDVDFYISNFEAVGFTSANMDLFRKEREMVLEQMFPRRVLDDMASYLEGDTWEDKLYLEIKHSRFHKFIYSLNVLMIRALTCFKRNSNWIKKYPIKFLE